MTIEQQISEELKAALRAKDQAKLNVLRQIKTEVAKAKSAADFSGKIDDDLYRVTIVSYCKRMDKARQEYVAAGERGREMAAALAFEVEYLTRWLPTKLDEPATRALVEQVVADLGVAGPQAMGRVMGAIMKKHKEQVDGTLVNRVVKAVLDGASAS